MVESLPASAGDTGSSPGPGGSHMPRSNWARAPQLLSLRSRACEPQLLKPMRLELVFRGGRGHRNEKPVQCNEDWPPLAAVSRTPRAAGKAQHSQK